MAMTVTHVNEFPAFEFPSVSIEVVESVEANTEIGDPIACIYPVSATLTHFLSGVGGGRRWRWLG